MAFHHDFSLCSRLAAISSSTGLILPQWQVTTSHSCPAMLAFPETQAHPSFITTSGGGILAQPFGAPMAALWLTHRKARLRKDGTQTSPTGSAENEMRDERKRSFTPTGFCSTPSGSRELLLFGWTGSEKKSNWSAWNRILPIAFQVWFPNVFSGLFARWICEMNTTNLGNSPETERALNQEQETVWETLCDQTSGYG